MTPGAWPWRENVAGVLALEDLSLVGEANMADRPEWGEEVVR